MKSYFTSDVIRELQIETMRCQHIPIKVPGTLTAPNADKDVKPQALSSAAGENAK